MRAKFLLLALSLCLTAWSQIRLSIEQLKSFVKSSIELKHDDKKVADYLRKVTLSHRLDEAVVQELAVLGAGARTIDALRTMSEASRNLPPDPKTAPKPKPTPIPGPPEAEQKKLLAEVSEYATHYTKRLPDFICVQVTRRYVDPTGLEFWQREDVITERLSYFEQKEDYKVLLVNNRPTSISHEQLGGASSTGEFGSMMREIFDPESKTRFEWERWARLRGRRTHVFSYEVPQPNSKWRITYERSLDIVPGYRGLIYVDEDTHQVMRVTLEAINIPPSFPIQQASTVLDYDFTKIGEAEFILPLKAVVRMRQGKLLVKNEVEFRMYRKFGAEATITFDTPEPLPEDQTQEQPIK